MKISLVFLTTGRLALRFHPLRSTGQRFGQPGAIADEHYYERFQVVAR